MKHTKHQIFILYLIITIQQLNNLVYVYIK